MSKRGQVAYLGWDDACKIAKVSARLGFHYEDEWDISEQGAGMIGVSILTTRSPLYTALLPMKP